MRTESALSSLLHHSNWVCLTPEVSVELKLQIIDWKIVAHTPSSPVKIAVFNFQDVGNTIADFSGDLDMREVFEEEFNQKFATRTHFLPSDRISGHRKIWDTIWSIPWTSQTVRYEGSTYDLTHKKPQSFVAKSTNFRTFFVFQDQFSQWG